MKRSKANWICCILLRTFLVGHVIERQVEGNTGGTEDIHRYWMTLMKLEDTGC